MSSKRGGLGKGLGAIFGNQAENFSNVQAKDVVQEIFVSAVQPNRYQPRKEFNQEALQDLAESIKAYGILQPIIVRKLGVDSFELIAGERRLRASKIVGLEKIPAIIREYTDAQTSEISIIENVQRQDLNVVEEARAYERLIRDFGHTQEELAAKIGRSRSYISNLLRLLNLAPKVIEFLSRNLLTTGQARLLLSIEDEELQIKAAHMIIVEDLSVRKVAAFINELRNSGVIPGGKPITESTKNVSEVDEKSDDTEQSEENDSTSKKNSNSHASEKNPEHEKYVKQAEDKLSEIVGTQVKIIFDSFTKQIRINFSDDAQLQQIIGKFEKNIQDSSGKTPSTKEEKISALRKFSTLGQI
ncbi:MAG: ParB/RepB/Spo0J family partition protein [Selenomonadaceae bacterium]|nr:ParB/RepB/Spo0J family partition protein [Selenomonadaceae bacterium]